MISINGLRKIIVILVLMALFIGLLNAQPYKNAIGLRLGYDAQEISYKRPFSDIHCLELTFGVNMLGHTREGKLCRGFVLNGLYQWVNDLYILSTGLKWYLGLGAAVLDHGSLSHGRYGAGVIGQIGVEYHFNSPWQLSLDYRPGFYWLPGAGNIYRISWNAPCIAIRYQF